MRSRCLYLLCRCAPHAVQSLLASHSFWIHQTRRSTHESEGIEASDGLAAPSTPQNEPEVEQQPPALGAAMAAPPETTSTAAETTTEEKLHVIGPVMAESVRVVTTAYAKRSDSHIKNMHPLLWTASLIIFILFVCMRAGPRRRASSRRTSRATRSSSRRRRRAPSPPRITSSKRMRRPPTCSLHASHVRW